MTERTHRERGHSPLEPGGHTDGGEARLRKDSFTFDLRSNDSTDMKYISIKFRGVNLVSFTYFNSFTYEVHTYHRWNAMQLFGGFPIHAREGGRDH